MAGDRGRDGGPLEIMAAEVVVVRISLSGVKPVKWR